MRAGAPGIYRVDCSRPERLRRYLSGRRLDALEGVSPLRSGPVVWRLGTGDCREEADAALGSNQTVACRVVAGGHSGGLQRVRPNRSHRLPQDRGARALSRSIAREIATTADAAIRAFAESRRGRPGIKVDAGRRL